MNEPSIEKIFSLEEIDYSRFWGQNDKLLEFVRLLFPKLKLIVRGDMLKAIGSEEDIAALVELGRKLRRRPRDGEADLFDRLDLRQQSPPRYLG